jgi:glycosyltransferase involved in cell wall biosynthesis
MMPPLVSVLMTAYNREKYIAEAIESVLASTFQDYELIVVDDCSSDKSYEIALTYAKKDLHIRVYRNERNLGDYPNRNRAASYAAGKYLKYIDADDYVYPHGLSVIVGMVERFPEAALGFASLEQDVKRPFPFQLSPREAYLRHYFEQPLFHKAPLSAIIRTEAFQVVGGFTGKRYVGDFELWHILAGRYPVVLMPQGVVWYREHSEQEMQQNRTSVLIPFEYLNIAVEQLGHPQCPLLPNERACAISGLKLAQARTIFRTLASGDCRCAREMLRRSGLSVGEALLAAFRKAPKP